MIATSLIHGDAVWDRVALDADELSFRVGDEVEVLDMTDDVWWYGSVEDVVGWFPASFVRVRGGASCKERTGLCSSCYSCAWKFIHYFIIYSEIQRHFTSPCVNFYNLICVCLGHFYL